MEKIIESINDVYNSLPPGLSESCYQKAVSIALREHFNVVELERSFPIFYKKHEITRVRADIVIDDEYVIECKKVTSKLSSKDEDQLRRYLHLSMIKFGILVNFGPSLEYKVIG